MTEHSFLGGSGASRWMACPPSAVVAHMNRDKEQPTSGRAAEEGTLAHKLLEDCLLAEGCPTGWIDLTIYDESDESIEGLFVDGETAAAVKVAYDYIMTVGAKGKIKVEQKVSYVPPKNVGVKLPPDTAIFGTADAIIETDDEIILVDYKHGINVEVNIEENFQLMFYMTCLLNTFYKGLIPHGKTLKGVIIQPRCFGNADIQEIEYSAKDIADFERSMIEAIKKICGDIDTSTIDESALQVGNHCEWCPFMANCPAKKDHAQEVATATFADAELDIDPDTQDMTMPNISGLTDDQIIRILEQGDTVIKWIKAVHSMAQADAELGRQFEGYKLVVRKGNAVWIDEEAALEAFEKEGFARVAMLDTKMKTQGALKKLVGNALVEEHLERPEKGLTLVKDSDKREAVIPNLEGLQE